MVRGQPFCKAFDTPKFRGSLRFHRLPNGEGPALVPRAGLFLITKMQRSAGTVLLTGYYFNTQAYQAFPATDGPWVVSTYVDRIENLNILTGSTTLWSNVCLHGRTVDLPLWSYKSRLDFAINRAARRFSVTSEPPAVNGTREGCEANWKLRTHEDIIAAGITSMTWYQDPQEVLQVYDLQVSGGQ